MCADPGHSVLTLSTIIRRASTSAMCGASVATERAAVTTELMRDPPPQGDNGAEEGATRTHQMSTVAEESNTQAGGERSGPMPMSFTGTR